MRRGARLLCQELFEILLEECAHGMLGHSPVGPDDLNHELLTQNRIGLMLLFRDHLQQNAARDLDVGFLVDYDEIDFLDDQALDLGQRDVTALHRVIKTTIRVFLDHSRFAHVAPRSCWPARRQRIPKRA
jgi:hypothetical protein